ncbi:hypothetical protein GALMADRAFT_727996 [Galerina marginata CBS 339.88]|uniref:F-box domain-containing protein n=1 Tax=Galerina marginata (strain CBS 339.88) TaxID=685588 RepID=A0A067SQU7_GALM3|nr:hypothetical protein GALMADRAFT_727996 [Galerina marginata CBS 339.88]
MQTSQLPTTTKSSVSAKSLHPTTSYEPTAFITNRLNLVISKQNAKTGISTKTLDTKKREGRSKNENKFVDLPQDVLFKICSYLEPMSLLSVARTSMATRANVMSNKAASLWKDVVKQVEDIPECPKDLTGPQYASLLFDDCCMGCGTTRGSIETDYKLRLRLCKACTKVNIVSGSQLSTSSEDLASVAFSMLPSNGPDLILYYPKLSVLDSKDNDSDRLYFLPEAKLTIVELDARRARKKAAPKEYKKFVADHRKIASRMMNEGLAIKIWVDAKERKEKEAIIAANRRIGLLEKMRALGWESKYYPADPEHSDTKKWNDYLDKAVEITNREWDKIRPEMEQIYVSHKKTYLTKKLIEHVGDTYAAYRAQQPVEIRQGMPPWLDVMHLSPMKEFLKRHRPGKYAESALGADIEALCLEFRSESSGFLLNARQELSECMALRTGESEGQGIQIPGIEDIDKAKVMFFCTCDARKGVQDEPMIIYEAESAVAQRWPREQLMGYPEMVCHWVDANADLAWELCLGDIRWSPKTMDDAEDILEVLGLDRNCGWKEVRELGGLVCECMHPEFVGALTFEQLTLHVHEERGSYARIFSRASVNPFI